MHGLINRAIQSFVVDSYGRDTWVEAMRLANLGFVEFESMLTYDDELTPKVLDAVGLVLNRGRDEVMEDIGTYLVSNPNVEALRRLLRFGGLDFVDFLNSLDDLPDRARLAVSDLILPGLELHDCAPGQFKLVCQSPVEGVGHVMLGVLRAMADDYGVLAVLEHMGTGQGTETICIRLIETEFAEGRAFELGVRAG